MTRAKTNLKSAVEDYVKAWGLDVNTAGFIYRILVDGVRETPLTAYVRAAGNKIEQRKIRIHHYHVLLYAAHAAKELGDRAARMSKKREKCPEIKPGNLAEEMEELRREALLATLKDSMLLGVYDKHGRAISL